MTQRVPQVIVSLTPEGQLKVELPGTGGLRHSVIMTEAEAGASLLRILQAQVFDQIEIGLDGAPTGQQLEHWERHAEWARPGCRFCLAEGRITQSKPKAKRRSLVERRSDGVEIRRLHEGLKAKAAQAKAKKTAEEMGL